MLVIKGVKQLFFLAYLDSGDDNGVPADSHKKNFTKS